MGSLAWTIIGVAVGFIIGHDAFGWLQRVALRWGARRRQRRQRREDREQGIIDAEVIRRE